MIRIAFLSLLFVSQTASAADFKMRAREHFEAHNITGSGIDEYYRGLSNTINLWWEFPYELSYGFSFSPVFSNLEDSSSDRVLGEDVTYINVGFEVKYFINKLIKNVYIRPGLTYAQLKPSNDLDDFTGHAFYLGVGYEIPFDMLGVAIEVAHRYADLSDGVSVESFTPSIGFHFYEMF